MATRVNAELRGASGQITAFPLLQKILSIFPSKDDPSVYSSR